MSFKEHKGMDLASVCRQMGQRWEQEQTFRRAVEEREGHPQFVFYEGPPSANGHPGIHHVMARTIKDAVCRYRTMQGYQVRRKAGWDTHGLPVELGVEKELGITKEDIGRTVSIEQYNQRCRQDVMKYTREWRDLSERMGYWVDLDHPYVTYENKYIETLWWLLSRLYQKGLLYKGYTIQPYSPAAGTGLSSHELQQPGCYRDVKDTTCTAAFRLLPVHCAEGEHGAGLIAREQALGHPVVALAWTTTPWTLPSNTALCVGPRLRYALVRTLHPYTGERLTALVCRDRLSAYFAPEGEGCELVSSDDKRLPLPWSLLGEVSGEDLQGLRYEQLVPWVRPLERLDEGSPAWVRGAAESAPERVLELGEQNRYVDLTDKAFRFIGGDFVTTDEGTGIVHIAPTFGADDARVAREAGVPSLFMLTSTGETRPMVDLRGRYYPIEELSPLFVDRMVAREAYATHAGQWVKNAYDPRFNQNGRYDEQAASRAEDLNLVLSLELRAQGKAWRIEKHVHSYPHCWRTDKPVLYYPLDSWFIRSSAMKERMVELNRTIQWKPESTGSGRFGRWLENLNDWNLSRSRYWGTPLPIWRNKQTREQVCIGSLQQLWDEVERSVARGVMKSNPLRERGFRPGDYSKENYDRIDLHRPYVDQIVLVGASGQPLHRETDLIDVWFDSGSMPYAQLHYPFENKELVDQGRQFPADFIAEGVDQTRGWFFTLHALATMVMDSVAFRNVISNGLVLDKRGGKMSKRLGNAVEPFGQIEKHGSDPLRWYMLTNAAPWDNLKFDEEGVEEVARSFFGKLYQTYSFLAMYANVDHWTPEGCSPVPESGRSEIDRWIRSELCTLTQTVTQAFENYEPHRAGRLIREFVVENLSNWYVRLSRRRFWAGEMTEDKRSAYQTLHLCLLTVAKLMAPIAPFYADQLYRDLTDNQTESVHLSTWPTPREQEQDKALEFRMETAQHITSMVLALRKKEKVIVRQPLQRVAVPDPTGRLAKELSSVVSLIANEVNVKQVDFVGGELLTKRCKCNFRVMGKKFGARMKQVAAAVAALTQPQIAGLEQHDRITLPLADGSEALVERADVEIVSQDMPGWSVESDGELTVALDLELTPELRAEGYAREVVKRIQTLRKETGLEITDHIHIALTCSPAMQEALQPWHVYICEQTLADQIAATVDGKSCEAEAAALELSGETLRFNIERSREN